MSFVHCPHCQVVMTASEREAGACGSCGAALSAPEPQTVPESKTPEQRQPSASTFGRVSRTFMGIVLTVLALISISAKAYRVFFEDRTIQVPADHIDRFSKVSPDFKKAIADARRDTASVQPQRQFAAEFINRIRQGEMARAYAMLTEKLQAELPLNAFEKRIADSPWIKEPGKGTLFMNVNLDGGSMVGLMMESGDAGIADIGVGTLRGGGFAVETFELRKK